MKAEIKSKWLAALRSGEYAQTSQVLSRVEDGKRSYCCLGVLCEVMGAKRDGNYKLPGDNQKHHSHGPDAPGNGEFYTFGGERDCGFPPKAILREADVSQDFCEMLADGNDTGLPFSAIADTIELESDAHPFVS